MTAYRPTISFAITCYNYAQYVGEAISSALAQTYDRVEVIVIDDGSTDNSAAVISGFGDRVRSIQQSNQGSIAAYNLGFSQSTGDIVIFLDADDRVNSTLAERVAELWYPECVKVQYELDIIGADGSSLGRRFCNFPSNYNANRVKTEFQLYGTYIWPVTTGNAYSRWFLNMVFPLTVTRGPDGFLNTIAPLFGDIVTYNIPLAAYRLHGANMWGLSDISWSTRINSRINEFNTLRLFAIKCNYILPDCNLLDNEVVFINYRMLAKILGQHYEGAHLDSLITLWISGVAVLLHRPTRFRLCIVHLLWMSILLISPRRLTIELIHLRAHRAQYLKRFRGALSTCWPRQS